MKTYNLLEEIYAIFDLEEVSEKDILWCGCEEFRTTWDQFKEVAKYTDYSNKSELVQDLIIMADGWYMEMNPYDAYSPDLFILNEIPKTPSVVKNIKYLSTKSDEYPYLSDLN